MPGERFPRRGGWGSNGSSPSQRRQVQPPPQPRRRWGSNLSTKRRERTTVWASCLHTVQALRQGGSWRAADSDSVKQQNQVYGGDGGAASRRSESNGRAGKSGGATEMARTSCDAEADLHAQLDVLAGLSYPNASISPQDAGFMVSALCEAVPLSSDKLRARVIQFYISLCGKQQKVTFSGWQLNIALDFFLGSLASPPGESFPVSEAKPDAPSCELHASTTSTSGSSGSSSSSSPPTRRECVRALAQLLYENGDRLGTRFDDILPPLLRLADPAAVDLENRHAALDALANLCLKNWSGLEEPQRQAVCSCLTENFVAHWRAFTTAVAAPSASSSSGAANATTGASSTGASSAERKILASATRGLACAVGKGGVSSVLEPYLARVVLALNHLVQPAGDEERAAAAARCGGGVGGGGGGGGEGEGWGEGGGGTSGSRSRSRGLGFGRSGSGGLSPTRGSSSSLSSSSPSLTDPRTRVRLQALTLLEAIASKDAKSVYPHWALFFAPCSQVEEAGGGTAGAGEVNISSTTTAAAVAGSSSPVLPAGLLSIMENDDAPQVRAAAAAAVASLVKNAPLRKWMPPPPCPSTRAAATAGVLRRGSEQRLTPIRSGGGGGRGGGGGIGQRVASMMLRLHRSLVVCLGWEQSPAVVAKLCACVSALVAELPYETATKQSSSSPRSSNPRGKSGGTTGLGLGLGGGLETSLGDLVGALARLMVDVAVEPSARIAASQALTAAFSTKEPLATIDAFLHDFRCGGGDKPSRNTSTGSAFPTSSFSSSSSAAATISSNPRFGSPVPLRAGGAGDRGNRFAFVGRQRPTEAKNPQLSSSFGRHGLDEGRNSSSSSSNGSISSSKVRDRRSDPSSEVATKANSIGCGDNGETQTLLSPPRKGDASGATMSHHVPSPRTVVAEVEGRGGSLEASSATITAAESHGGGGGGGEAFVFVDHLIALAGAPGQLRADALGLLTRIGRSYSAHLSGNGGLGGAGVRDKYDDDNDDDNDKSVSLPPGRPDAARQKYKRWERASALLLRCFADPDQNLRLHALKVLEALLLARAERAAEATAIATTPTMAPPRSTSKGDGGGFTPGALPVPPPASGDVGNSGVHVCRPNGDDEKEKFSRDDPRGGGGGGGGDGGGAADGDLWRDLVQKHMQRALEDPYHGVRAVACSCHGFLLGSDWQAFSDRERHRCLDRVLAATRDRAAGVNILACRVVAGLMVMAGQEETAAWSREPEFLGRCAARLEEMMGDPKVSIRAQAMLAVGNLSFSLHRVRSQETPLSTDGRAMKPPPPPTSSSSSLIIPRSRLRSLCEGALRLTTVEPDHAAGSAVRALGYLAWGLGGGGGGGGGGHGDGTDMFARGSPAEEQGRRISATGEATGMKAASMGDGPKKGLVCAVEDRGPESEEEDDDDGRHLQDRAVVALTTRLASDKAGAEGDRGRGGARGGGGGGVAVDRRADIAAAKCRWNCCIALGVMLSAPAIQTRMDVASWTPALMRSLRRAMEEDRHLKVRTHAAHALKTVPGIRAYGDQLPAVLGGALRSLQDCRQGTAVSDPTQIRYAVGLEAVLRALVLHILIALVLGDVADGGTTDGEVVKRGVSSCQGRLRNAENEITGGDGGGDTSPPSLLLPLPLEREGKTGAAPATAKELVGAVDRRSGSTEMSGGSDTLEAAYGDRLKMALLEEYAEEFLVVLSSPEADTALSFEELLPYRHHGMAWEKEEEELMIGDGLIDENNNNNNATVKLHQVETLAPPTVALAESVLRATAAGLVRVFDDSAGGGGGLGGARDYGRVSKRTWQACVAEAGRRRLRVVETLGGRGKGGLSERARRGRWRLAGWRGGGPRQGVRKTKETKCR